jgi:hypothetical protein
MTGETPVLSPPVTAPADRIPAVGNGVSGNTDGNPLAAARAVRSAVAGQPRPGRRLNGRREVAAACGRES